VRSIRRAATWKKSNQREKNQQTPSHRTTRSQPCRARPPCGASHFVLNDIGREEKPTAWKCPGVRRVAESAP
jgi:hypothetical protein